MAKKNKFSPSYNYSSNINKPTKKTIDFVNQRKIVDLQNKYNMYMEKYYNQEKIYQNAKKTSDKQQGSMYALAQHRSDIYDSKSIMDKWINKAKSVEQQMKLLNKKK